MTPTESNTAPSHLPPPLLEVPRRSILARAVLLVAVFGFLFAVFQLLPLLMALGPEGNAGELFACFKRAPPAKGAKAEGNRA